MLPLSTTLAALLVAQPATVAVATTAATKSTPDVVYAKLGGEELKLDLVLPTTPGPHPCVICFHGGAWTMGNRKDLTRPALFNPGGRDANKDIGILEKLARQGYVAVSASYRLAPKHKFPAQVEDAKTAVRFLRANAKTYDIDPDRIGAVGFSAGGHLVLMLGLTDSSAGFDGKLYPDVSSGVTCVVDFFGPTDMSLYAESDGLVASLCVPFLGKECLADPTCYTRASPIEYVSKAAKPTLILHGTMDLLVPIVHSERLAKKMKEAGAECELVPVRWKGHGWEGDTAKDSALKSLEFLDKHLKKAEKK
jgi:acetyl esterase/lipase